MATARWRSVIDTNVVFEGLTRRGSAPGVIIDAWLGGLFDACISNPLGYEYSRRCRGSWRPSVGWRFGRHSRRLTCAVPIDIRYSWRPSSPDPADEHIVDCAMNANAVVVTSNIRDFQMARASLGLPVMTPVEFLIYLDAETETALTDLEMSS